MNGSPNFDNFLKTEMYGIRHLQNAFTQFPFFEAYTICRLNTIDNKLALLWGEAQLCLPYVCL